MQHRNLNLPLELGLEAESGTELGNRSFGWALKNGAIYGPDCGLSWSKFIGELWSICIKLCIRVFEDFIQAEGRVS